ncbi:MAG: hypothetical protein FJZ96_13345 [Chloroflexi bacterium]|nr:hypothetical protein [Chloroflexota bacterium]
MKKPIHPVLFWLPRILGILFVLFISMFSLDVFSMGGGFWVTQGGFFVHNLPSLALAVTLAAGWRREWIAAVGFFFIGIRFLLMADAGDAIFVVVFSVIPFLVGALFLAGWLQRRKNPQSKIAG